MTNPIAPLDQNDIAAMSQEMQALNPRQRAFVMNALEFPHLAPGELVRRSGYSVSTDASARVAGWRLAHDERILKAFHAEAHRRLRSTAILGASVIADIARNPQHKDQLRAASMLLNRIGLHEKTEHTVNVEHSVDDEALVERIKLLAAELGIDAKQLLGASASQKAKIVDAEVIAVQPGDEPTADGLEDVL